MVVKMQSLSMDLGQETDTGLMLLMGAAGPSAEEQEIARASLRELHRRYYPYILSIAESFSENMWTVEIDPEGMATAVFRRAYDKADSFQDKSGGDAKRAERQVKAWLGRIARNLLRDALDKIKRRSNYLEIVPLDESLTIPEPDDEPENDFTSTSAPALAALRDALEALKPEDREILLTYAAFGIPTKSGRELPKDVRESLEDRTGYERSNIRQKWLRLSRRLKSELEQYVNPTVRASNQ